MFLSLVPDFRFIRSLNLHAGAFLESLVTFVRAGVGKFGHSKGFKKEIPWNGEAALHENLVIPRGSKRKSLGMAKLPYTRTYKRHQTLEKWSAHFF